MRFIWGICVLLGAFLSQSIAFADSTSFAVVELFTSEGCSSCPSADILLSKIVESSRQKGLSIFPLSFHVDYWNQLGWRDRYSKAAFSQRQYAYQHVIKDGVYTPQMIINGETSCVGHDVDQVKSAIDHALMQTSKTAIKITKIETNEHLINLYFETKAPLDSQLVINAALVERGLQTSVQRGENAGRILKHDNVVREFQSTVLQKEENRVSLNLDGLKDSSQASVILYMQDTQTMRILAATGVDLG